MVGPVEHHGGVREGLVALAVHDVAADVVAVPLGMEAADGQQQEQGGAGDASASSHTR